MRVFALIPFFLSLSAFAQVEEINPNEEIKTITFKGDTPESQLPILKLGEPLVLEFDVLNGNEDDYYYEISHYNYDWTPSVLMQSEYLQGFNEQRIRRWDNSINTYQIYSHFTLSIPNEQTRAITKSGNYLITIYNEDDDIEFTRKFMIYEDIANVGVAIKRSREVLDIKEKHSVDIAISSSVLRFNNPLETVRTVIIQNNNLNTAIKNVKPQYILGNQLQYRYVKETSFYAGNEYKYFENKNLRGANIGVQFIELKDLYNSYLYKDVSRVNRAYTYNPDINGNFLITALDTDNPTIGADYAQVHFTLELNKLSNGQTLHVYGNFNNYAVEESTQLTYYKDEGTYEGKLLLKQGFYSYKYIVKNKDGSINENAISGNFYQTENSYKVLVYYTDLGARYDRIIGLGEGNSVNITN
ncbi:type IX secretion system plug protein [Lacinutrix jangbogonensis]|uniref:type IX secretion system plug protein n=1 Tax=Lacinutrix jangbogonensis TaxID=1469557 RepID=UPI00053D3A54|nr:type IX secretion system plug protein domain-containing protein [Lacinutrix jangbogonensis]